MRYDFLNSPLFGRVFYLFTYYNNGKVINGKSVNYEIRPYLCLGESNHKVLLTYLTSSGKRMNKEIGKVDKNNFNHNPFSHLLLHTTNTFLRKDTLAKLQNVLLLTHTQLRDMLFASDAIASHMNLDDMQQMPNVIANNKSNQYISVEDRQNIKKKMKRYHGPVSQWDTHHGVVYNTKYSQQIHKNLSIPIVQELLTKSTVEGKAQYINNMHKVIESFNNHRVSFNKYFTHEQIYRYISFIRDDGMSSLKIGDVKLGNPYEIGFRKKVIFGLSLDGKPDTTIIFNTHQLEELLRNTIETNQSRAVGHMVNALDRKLKLYIMSHNL